MSGEAAIRVCYANKDLANWVGNILFISDHFVTLYFGQFSVN